MPLVDLRYCHMPYLIIDMLRYDYDIRRFRHVDVDATLQLRCRYASAAIIAFDDRFRHFRRVTITLTSLSLCHYAATPCCHTPRYAAIAASMLLRC